MQEMSKHRQEEFLDPERARTLLAWRNPDILLHAYEEAPKLAETEPSATVSCKHH
jgi:hypothetical protein